MKDKVFIDERTLRTLLNELNRIRRDSAQPHRDEQTLLNQLLQQLDRD